MTTAVRIDETEPASLRALSENKEIAIIQRGKGGFEVMDDGGAYERTVSSFMDGVFGAIPTANRGRDSYTNPGRDKLTYLTADMTPAAYQAFFGANPHVEKTVSYKRHYAVGSEPTTDEVRLHYAFSHAPP